MPTNPDPGPVRVCETPAGTWGGVPADLTVIRPGTRADFVGDGVQDVLVTAVEVHPGDRIRYEVVWWVNGVRNTAWVSAVEVVPKAGNEPLRIGFRE